MAKKYFEKCRKARRAQILELALKKYSIINHVLDFGVDGEGYRYELEEAYVNPETLKITLLYKPLKKD